MKSNDLEAINFCGETYIFEETGTSWVLSRFSGAISITYSRLPGEKRNGFDKRLRSHEREVEDRFCMSCTNLCQTTDSVCRLYEKNKFITESEDA